MDRRTTFKLLAVSPLAALAACSDADQVHIAEARRKVDAAAMDGGLSTRKPEFFTDHELTSARELADLIIPADDVSGAASSANVAEFMDFIMIDQPWNQTKMRGGLAWIDGLSRRTSGKNFVDCSDSERRQVADLIAYPDDVLPENEPGATFFSYFRNLTASGFWSSKIGVDDLQYLGNVGVGEWTGCPKECTDHLGVSYS
ncbi:MAG: gluconate 2-dehydrogenase subunit 3 family protein [Bacteroidetes bacterium]|nr:gluconate 2-dehydrogenase subunit 3 family protein [Bacteroidota bacterium]